MKTMSAPCMAWSSLSVSSMAALRPISGCARAQAFGELLADLNLVLDGRMTQRWASVFTR